MKLLVALAAAAALAGCTTTPPGPGEASPVPADRVLSRAHSAPDKNKGTVVITRDAGAMGSACSHTFSYEGQELAVLRQGEFFVVHVKPAESIFGIRPGGGLCGSQLIETPLRVEAGTTKALRISLDINGVLRLQQSSLR